MAFMRIRIIGNAWPIVQSQGNWLRIALNNAELTVWLGLLIMLIESVWVFVRRTRRCLGILLGNNARLIVIGLPRGCMLMCRLIERVCRDVQRVLRRLLGRIVLGFVSIDAQGQVNTGILMINTGDVWPNAPIILYNFLRILSLNYVSRNALINITEKLISRYIAESVFKLVMG